MATKLNPEDLDFFPTYPLSIRTFASKSTGSDRESMGDLDEDDDDSDDDGDEDDEPKPKGKKKSDEDDDKDDDEDDEPTPEEVRAENARLKRALRKANRRDLKKRLGADFDPKKAPKKKSREDDDEDDVDDRIEKARQDEREKANEKLIRSEAKSALLKAGLDGEGEAGSARLARVIRALDFDDLSVDDNGNVVGLQDAIDELKEDTPELFKRPRKRRGINGGDTRDDRGKPRKMSASERQAAQLKK